MLTPYVSTGNLGYTIAIMVPRQIVYYYVICMHGGRVQFTVRF